MWGKELPKKHEDRFFPANGVYASNRNISHRHNFEDLTIEFDTLYYDVWTGNDTIVDGRECVAVWKNIEGEVMLHGVIYESLNGVVYFNYRTTSNQEWMTLYDFTPRRWKAGDMICLHCDGISEKYEKVKGVSSVTLHNGETAPLIQFDSMAEGLIYGIGYKESTFLNPEVNGTPISFYRNGVLLWGKEEQSGNSVAAPMINKVLTPYYDLQGRPVAAPMRGIYIKNGKKVVIK